MVARGIHQEKGNQVAAVNILHVTVSTGKRHLIPHFPSPEGEEMEELVGQNR